MKKLFLFLVLASLISCSKKSDGGDPPPQGGPKTQKDIASIDKAVTDFMTTYSIPGVSIAVTKDGKLVYLKSYGKMSATDPTAITNDNLFRIASVSKPITAVWIMKLLEAGKLTMDSKVFGPSSILGADFPSAPTATHSITIRNLLHHTTVVWGNNGNDPMFKQPTYNHAQLIKWTLENYPATTGRGTYVYSNFGYCILGRVIEKLSGKTYEQFIKDEVLTPSGITGMKMGGSTLADRVAGEVVYTGQSGQNPYIYNIPRMDSHGGWLASAKDLAKFMIRVDGFSSKPDILSPTTITTMTTRSVPSSNYASGLCVNSANNWWHTGGLPGTATEIIRSPSGFNWVILCNSRSTNANFNTDMDSLLWPFVIDANTPWQDIDQF